MASLTRPATSCSTGSPRRCRIETAPASSKKHAGTPWRCSSCPPSGSRERPATTHPCQRVWSARSPAGSRSCQPPTRDALLVAAVNSSDDLAEILAGAAALGDGRERPLALEAAAAADLIVQRRRPGAVPPSADALGSAAFRTGGATPAGARCARRHAPGPSVPAHLASRSVDRRSRRRHRRGAGGDRRRVGAARRRDDAPSPASSERPSCPASPQRGGIACWSPQSTPSARGAWRWSIGSSARPPAPS